MKIEHYEQQSIFDYVEKYKIKKPIRLIELFAGYGSQSLALKYLGIDFESWKICEWAKKSIQAYKDLHILDNNDYSKNLSKQEVINFLYEKGISYNYNEPASLNTLTRERERELRNTYNNIIATHNLVNIQKAKGSDLEIVETNKYEYIMTYSFPCQDLSLAGNMKGMEDTTTRSGMLWEVERLLDETKEKPQILLMENVVQVHSKQNEYSFNKWLTKLERLGYSNFVMDLNAKDFGVPQNRNRAFVLSLLGNYNYEKPKPFKLKTKLKDLLEDNVDESFYITAKQINDIVNWNSYEKPLGKMEKTTKSQVSPTLTTRTWDYCGSMILVDECEGAYEWGKSDRFMGKQKGIAIKNATKQGYLIANIGDGIDISSRMKAHRGTVQKCMAQTLTTKQNVGVCVENRKIKENINTQFNTAEDEEKYALAVGCGQDLRIRKLTPKECFRLMGVKDEDFEKVRKNQTDSSLYHLAGDSIVVDVLMNIFKQLF